MRRGRVRHFALGVVLTLLGLAVVCQLLLPGYLEGRIEDRLERRGGEADVELSALPALRLLGEGGDRIVIDGRAVQVDLTERREAFEKLDGFDEVDIAITDARAGPFAVERFELDRAEGDDDYGLRVDAATTPSELARFAASALAGAVGRLIAGMAAGSLGDRSLPVELDMRLRSEDGRVRVISGGGSVVGIPTGPLGVALANAIVARL
jgi:hypothetical protein